MRRRILICSWLTFSFFVCLFVCYVGLCVALFCCCFVCVCVCVCVRACVRACVRECVRARVRECVCCQSCIRKPVSQKPVWEAVNDEAETWRCATIHLRQKRPLNHPHDGFLCPVPIHNHNQERFDSSVISVLKDVQVKQNLVPVTGGVRLWLLHCVTLSKFFIALVSSLSPFVRSLSPFVRSLSPFVRSLSPFVRSLSPFVRSLSPFVRSLSPFVSPLLSFVSSSLFIALCKWTFFVKKEVFCQS